MEEKPRLLLVITEDWYFWSHRRPVAEAAKAAGFDVTIATRVGDLGDQMENAGFNVVPIKMRRTGRNPFGELLTILELIRIYRQLRPTIVHHVAVKPILYGSIAAAVTRVDCVVNAIAGLGYVFQAEGHLAALRRRLVGFAYRLALGRPRSLVILQNTGDEKTLLDLAILSPDKSVIIGGSGVDLAEFRPVPEPSGPPVVMLPARILWDKGVGEFVEAGKLLHAKGLNLRMVLVGQPDPANPRAVPEEVLRSWAEDGCVEWWGHRTDMGETLARANIVVLPSYGEGAPKVLFEAAAVGRALIASDVPGCRVIVRHGENGLVTPVRDAPGLASAIEKLVAEPETRRKYGESGRKIVEAEFTSERIASQTIELYNELLAESCVPDHQIGKRFST